MSLAVGSPIPSFTLPTDGAKTLSTTDISKGPAIIYFYPKDATPGCTCEAQDFRDFKPQLEQMGATVVGVSKDSVESHDAFVNDLSLNFPLISDDGTLCEAFGVWKLRKRGDREFMGIERSTFLLKDGVIVKEWRGMKATGHAAQVMDALKAL
ncbi:putative peroxiredoxin bcp [Gracilariopsis chorda]|uniref:thioredoxin-dependent peroxiredoxin n=1 Tax=Gracilariopsis chorda TaxID=448386 RepID=A0A2V3IVN9_9FLOR|nr:putative peroxiredoxin bcp [Gracilariopsis chorda]|eukprot:PXF46153.1 putative peroxiredoxin bcp [Gracilariopsis chorda]